MPRVAVVVLDTLRKDYFDAYFDWLPGRRFTRAFSTANWTSPAHASLFTGRYPSETGVHAKSPDLDVPGTVLPERAAEDGYRTRCWTANPNLSRKRNWDRGFDEFVGATALLTGGDTVDWNAFGAAHDASGYRKYAAAVLECVRSDTNTLASVRQGLRYVRGGTEALKTVPDSGAVSVLRRVREGRFGDDELLLVNLMEAHTPYFPPRDHRHTDEEVTVTIKHSLGIEEPERPAREVRRAYEGAVAYLSSIYEEIFRELIGEFDYVVTISDHGEMLGEHGRWNHTYGLYPEITRVPCVISGDGLDGTSDAVVSLLDIHETLRGLLDVPADSRGRNLLEDPDGRCSLAEYHGLIPVAVRRLRDENVPQRDVDRYDRHATALAAPRDYYGYEHEGEFRESGTATVDVHGRLSEIRADMSRRRRHAEEESPEVNREQLEHLGYI